MKHTLSMYKILVVVVSMALQNTGHAAGAEYYQYPTGTEFRTHLDKSHIPRHDYFLIETSKKLIGLAVPMKISEANKIFDDRMKKPVFPLFDGQLCGFSAAAVLLPLIPAWRGYAGGWGAGALSLLFVGLYAYRYNELDKVFSTEMASYEDAVKKGKYLDFGENLLQGQNLYLYFKALKDRKLFVFGRHNDPDSNREKYEAIDGLYLKVPPINGVWEKASQQQLGQHFTGNFYQLLPRPSALPAELLGS